MVKISYKFVNLPFPDFTQLAIKIRTIKQMNGDILTPLFIFDTI